MPDDRCWRVPGGTYFFTINLLERRSDLLVRHIEALREAVRRTRRERPFRIDGWVLPEHTHCILTLPAGDADFSNRIKAIKIRFVRAIPATERRSRVRVARLGRNAIAVPPSRWLGRWPIALRASALRRWSVQPAAHTRHRRQQPALRSWMMRDPIGVRGETPIRAPYRQPTQPNPRRSTRGPARIPGYYG
jgi:REP element-mobilizing transposase RayT